MREQIDDELKITLSQNRIRMKKVKAVTGSMLMMSLVLLLTDGIFFIVGGLNFYCFIGIIMNIIVFLSGTYGYDRKILHYVLIGLNFAAAVGFIVWYPASVLLLRIGIMQHLYLALEMYIFRRYGKEKEELSYELGYPYFSERAFFQSTEAEYTPDNDINASAGDMEVITEPEKISESPASFSMDEISVHEMPETAGTQKDSDVMEEISAVKTDDSSFAEQKVSRSENIYADMYSAKAEKVKPVEVDRELLEKNRIAYKNYRRSQSAVFIADFILAYITGCWTVEGAVNAFRGHPMEIFNLFMLLGVITASVITVTCMKEKQVIDTAMYCFAAAGVWFTVFSLNPVFFEVFMGCAAQMFIAKILSGQDESLRNQLGYPYFTEATIQRNKLTEGYKPEHNLNFSSGNMDEI